MLQNVTATRSDLHGYKLIVKTHLVSSFLCQVSYTCKLNLLLKVIPGTVYGVVTDLSKILTVRNDSVDDVPVQVMYILYSSTVLKSSAAPAFRNIPAAMEVFCISKRFIYFK